MFGEEIEQIDVQTMPSTYEGYSVVGKIKIDSIDVEQYILNSSDDAAYEKGVVVLNNNGSINNYGNFAIAGHNYENIFGKLNELNLGDKITLIEKDYTETEYVVVSTDQVDPNNLECLLQDDSKIELTLITCSEDSVTRFVVKAIEKEQYEKTSLENVVENEIANITNEIE